MGSMDGEEMGDAEKRWEESVGKEGVYAGAGKMVRLTRRMRNNPMAGFFRYQAIL